MALPRIFVSIASYRDTECQWTIKDLFDKAHYPDRVFAGICQQFVKGEDDDCFLVETRPGQCRVVEVDADDSRGACWARAKCQALWRGEEYFFQIDSHMRFVTGWDERLLAMLAECPSPRAVLSTYPPGYTPPDTLSPEILPVIIPKGFDSHGILLQRSHGEAPPPVPAPPPPTAFAAAGMLFAPAAIITEVPYDPFLYFQGEEITLAVRLWTHGWDLFTPNRVIAWHDYTKRPTRRRHWDDSAAWARLNEQSFARVRHLLGMEHSDDPEVTRELDRYGLGDARSLAEYEAFSRVDFKNRLYEGKTAEQLAAALSPEEGAREVGQTFTRIYNDNAWRSPETRSGDGATLARTEALRAELPRLLDFLGIRILADAGCGDLNWMRLITGPLRFYFGFDVVEPLIDDLRRRFAGHRNHFFRATNIATGDLPECDAILCRDCLTHLPLPMVTAALARFKASGARWLLATTFQTGANQPIAVGGWQAIDLTAPPFNLPPPHFLISEQLAGTSKSMGVWHTRDLP